MCVVLRVCSVPQAVVRVVTPCVYAALGEHAAIHLLPAVAVMLYDWLVRYAEGRSSEITPVRWV